MKKVKTIVLTASMAIPALLGAQPQVATSDAQGYLERGKLMYESRNYLGTIDQMYQMKALTSNIDMQEQADYYIALSRFERDEANTLETLQAFVAQYPSSTLLPDVLMRIGNYHFYKGDYGMALTFYSQVREKALDDDLNEDLIYREAYCDLQLEQYADAHDLYEKLKGTKRYNDATHFYNAYIDYANKRYDAAYSKFEQINRTGELGYQSQYYMCQIDYNHQDYDQVISLGESLIEDNANEYFNPEINRLVGESYYQKGNYSKAKKHLNTYLQTTQDPVMRSSSYALGVMDYKDGNYKSAVTNFSEVVKESDKMAQNAYYHMGQSQLQLGDTRSAAMAFEKAASMNYDATVKENAFYNYAVTQAKGSSTPFGNDITLFEEFLNEYPNSKYKSSVEEYLVQAYMNTSNYDKALASIERIQNPGAPILKAKQTVLYNMGVQALQKGERGDAANYMKKAIAVGNYDKKIVNESRLWLAETQYLGGDYDNTVNSLSTYVKEADKTDANYGQALYNLGYAQYQKKKYGDARKSFLQAVEAGNLDESLLSDAYDRIGDTYYYAGDFKNAESYYGKAISAATGDADGSMYDKAMMAAQQKDYESTISQLNEMLQKYPESTKASAAVLEKARAYEALGKNSEAIKTYQELAEKYPKSLQARQGLLQMASIEKNNGNQDKAIVAYKEVLTSAPSSEEAKVAAEDLKVIYADRGELSQFKDYLETIPNAPQLDVADVDRLTFESAEKAAVASKPSITKMEQYLNKYPEGAYAATAKYYIGRYNYEKGNYSTALSSLNEGLTEAADANWAEAALTMKSDILAKQGKQEEAIEVYKQIIEKTSSNDNKIIAQMGIIRTATDIKKYDEVVATANQVISNPDLTVDEVNEVKLNRANANAALGNTTAAEADYKELAKDSNNEVGAEAAYQLAEMNFNAGNTKTAESQVNELLESGTSQTYWIARGYLLLSDILAKEGNTSDAREYLESLKSNYPGKEKDIFNGIETRLSKLKGGSKTTTTTSTGSRSRNANSSADNKPVKKRK